MLGFEAAPPALAAPPGREVFAVVAPPLVAPPIIVVVEILVVDVLPEVAPPGPAVFDVVAAVPPADRLLDVEFPDAPPFERLLLATVLELLPPFPDCAESVLLAVRAPPVIVAALLFESWRVAPPLVASLVPVASAPPESKPFVAVPRMAVPVFVEVPL